MEITPLSRENLADWAACIPPELFTELFGGSGLRAIGASFLGEPCAAAVWEPRENSGVLHSLYVQPHARRLGLGGELMASLSEELRAAGLRRLSLSYAEEGERRLLTPFLLWCGCSVEAEELSLGVSTVGKAAEAARRLRLPPGAENGRALRELSPLELRACAACAAQRTGLSLRRYLGEKPESFACMREEGAAGLLLLSTKGEAVAVDYCWAAPRAASALPRLIALAAASLRERYAPETRLEAVLSTEEAARLFGRLLGAERETVTLCGGSFVPLPRRLLAPL